MLCGALHLCYVKNEDKRFMYPHSCWPPQFLYLGTTLKEFFLSKEHEFEVCVQYHFLSNSKFVFIAKHQRVVE